MAGPSLLAQNAQQQQPTQKKAKAIKIKKKRVTPDEFAATWLPQFAEHDIELEGAQQAQAEGGLKLTTEDGEEVIATDGDDDYHLRQLDAVGHGLDLLEAFDTAAAGVLLTKKSYKEKHISVNPFTAADELRKFVISFLEMWQAVKNEKYYHGMPRHGKFMRQFTKKLHALLERAHKMAPNVIKSMRGRGGG